MDYERILEKLNKYNCISQEVDEAALLNWEKAFEIEYTHESTAIEGNTLTLMETKVVLEDAISVGGKQLREIYEVVNHRKAYKLIKSKLKDGGLLSEELVKDIHAQLMENIFQGGFYRNVNVRITGAGHRPPDPSEAFRQMKLFLADMEWRSKGNPLEYAAWTHAEFVRIHPFVDGNGRTSRLIMNYQLIRNGFLPVSVPKTERLEYFLALEEYATKGNIQPFVEYVAKLEERRLDELIGYIENK